MPLSLHPLRSRLAAWRSSERGRNLLFYAGYFRWPALFILAAVTVDKAIYYGGLPLVGYLAGQADYVAARVEFARGRDQQALGFVRAALLHTRENAAFWKLAGRIAGRLDSPEAAYCWQQVDRIEPGDFARQIRIAESALHYQQLDLTVAALNEVTPADQEKIPFLRAAGELADACGEKQTARDYFSRIEARSPADAATLGALARWHAESDDPAELSHARAQLLALLSHPGKEAEARRLLIRVALKSGDAASAKKWSDDLLQSGRASFDDRVRRLDILRGPSFDAALAELMSSTRREEIVSVVEWLTAHHRAEQGLIWIRRQPEETQDDPVVGRARADCLSALGLWEHLRDIQAADTWPGHEPERLMYLARAGEELGSEPDARAAWTRAVVACAAYPDYLVLLDYLAQNQPSAFRDDARVQVWSRMVSHYPGQAWIVRALLQDALARRDSVRVQDCRAQLAALAPQDADAEARYALVCLLRGARVGKASAALARLRRDDPGDPVVATASGYDFYRQGKFGEALTVLGALTPEELNAPERAVYLAALLAASGPVDQATIHWQAALTQPGLLDEERALAKRAGELISYREAMAGLLHPPGAGFFSDSTDTALSRVGQSVAYSRAGDAEKAAQTLAGIDPGQLDAAGLSIYLGGVLALSGAPALPYLELSVDLPFETASEKYHRALEAWWNLQSRAPHDPSILAGLFAVYRALDSAGDPASFWLRDASRQIRLVRLALLHGVAIGAAQERLHGLLGHVPFTPEIQAELAYALLLQGQAYAAQQRMEVLAPADLIQPEPSLYYGVILAACGEKKAAAPYLHRAEESKLMPEEYALAAQAEKMP